MNSNKFEETYINIEEFTLIYIQLLAAVIFVYIFFVFDKLGGMFKKVLINPFSVIYINEVIIILIFFAIPIIIYFAAIYSSYLILFKFKLEANDDVVTKYRKLNKCYKYYNKLRKLIILTLILLLLLSLVTFFMI